MKHTAPITVKLDDIKAEQVNQDHSRKLRELQGSLFAGAEYVTTRLANGVSTQVPHRLGRTPTLVIPSAIRGAATAGLLLEVSRDAHYVTMNASGFGATISVDLVVA